MMIKTSQWPNRSYPLTITAVLYLVLMVAAVSPASATEERWTDPRTVAITQDDWSEIALARDNESTIHMACSDGDLLMYVKMDLAGNWSSQPMNVAGMADNCQHVGLVLDRENNVHIVWDDERMGEDMIYYSKVSQDGNLSIKARPVSEGVDQRSYKPDIAIDSLGSLHVCWLVEQYTTMFGGVIYEDIFYQKLDGNGNKLGQTIQVTERELPSEHPQRYDPCVTLDSRDEVILSWLDSRDELVVDDNTYPEHELYFCRLDQAGNKMVQDTRLTSNDYNYIFQDMVVDREDVVHIVARGDETNGGYDGVLWYMKLDRDGTILMESDDVSDIRDRAYDPVISVVDDTSVVLFYEYNGQNTTFYYSLLDRNGTQLARDRTIWAEPGDFGNTFDIKAVSDNSDLYVVWSVSATFDDGKDETRAYYMTNHHEDEQVRELENDGGAGLLSLNPVPVHGRLPETQNGPAQAEIL